MKGFVTNIASNATSIVIGVGLKIVGALIFWIVALLANQVCHWLVNP